MTNLGTTNHLDQGIAAEPGDIIYCTEDNKIYEYYDDGPGKPFGWREYEIDKSALLDLGITEYEINKMVIAKLPSLINKDQLAASRELIDKYTHKFSGTQHYYMLLCNELHYYTVFDVRDVANEDCADVVLECLQDIGVIQQINKSDVEDAIECWIKNDKGVFMFMLFNYDWGVVVCQ
jgi:hypothetical protein